MHCTALDTQLVHSDSTQNGWIEVFRAGDYRDQGKAQITRADLERVVAGYNPEYHEAPVCIGHPQDNLPAYAWVGEVKLDGDTLFAKEKQVDPQFAELRKAGRFKKRSASFYRDANGKISGLRHVGYLGALPPAVKGLKNVNFGDDAGREFIEVEFGEEETVAETQKSVKDEIRDFFAELFGKKISETGATFSEADVKRIVSESITAATAPLLTKVTTLETQMTAQGAEFAEREKKLASGERSTRVGAAIAGLKEKGKWIPAFDKMGLPLVFGELEKVTSTVEFGEAGTDGKVPQVTPLQVMVSFMEGLPTVVPAGRLVTPGAASSAQRSKPGTGDPLTDAAKARAADKKITFSEALDQVVAEQPELVNAGASAAGSV